MLTVPIGWNSTAIQAALDSPSRRIMFLDGEYNLENTIRIGPQHSHKVIDGISWADSQGGGPRLRPQGDFPAIEFAKDVPGVNVLRTLLSKIHIVPGDNVPVCSAGIVFREGLGNLSLQHVSVSGCEVGFLFCPDYPQHEHGGVGYSTFRECHFWACNDAGIAIRPVNLGWVNCCAFVDCRMQGGGRCVDIGTAGLATGNVFERGSWEGGQVGDFLGVDGGCNKFSGIRIESEDASGILVLNGSGSVSGTTRITDNFWSVNPPHVMVEGQYKSGQWRGRAIIHDEGIDGVTRGCLYGTALLTGDLSAGATVIPVDTVVGYEPRFVLKIGEGSEAEYKRISSVGINTITVSSSLCNDHDTGEPAKVVGKFSGINHYVSSQEGEIVRDGYKIATIGPYDLDVKRDLKAGRKIFCNGLQVHP